MNTRSFRKPTTKKFSGRRGFCTRKRLPEVADCLRRKKRDPDHQLEQLERELKSPVKSWFFPTTPYSKAERSGFCASWDYTRIRDVREENRTPYGRAETSSFYATSAVISILTALSRVTLKDDGTPRLEYTENSKKGFGLQIGLPVRPPGHMLL